jgi:UDP-N-acetylglucosamine 2-epimerase (non-hydrolysing)
MKRVLFILGTRPEAIKLQPIISRCANLFDIKICLTNQHSDTDNVLLEFKQYIIKLKLTRNEFGLSGLMGNILILLDQEQNIKTWRPDLIIVHGDTTSSLCGALYSYYEQIPLCHIESGLRTNDKFSPFPEESNRKIIDYLSTINFAPTILNKNNLSNENIINNVYVVGNSIIDVLKNNLDIIDINIDLKLLSWISNNDFGLITLHRRENWKNNIEKALKEISIFCLKNEYRMIYVCNQNTTLQNLVKKTINNNPFIYIVNSLENKEFHHLILKCNFIITDSGGIQEEASFLGKPLLVLRNTTERQEIINTNCGLLLDIQNIQNTLLSIINKNINFNQDKTLYGNGTTSIQIAETLRSYLNNDKNNL